MSLNKVDFFLSERFADAGHSDPDLSLGGAQNATEISSQTVVFDGGGIAGITLVRGSGNADGVGTLEYINTGVLARWTPPGGAAAGSIEEVDISVNGDYVLTSKDGDEHITITVVSASLPGSDTSDTVTVTGVLHNLFSTVTQSQSLNGTKKYRCIFVDNIHTLDLNVKFWVSPNYSQVGSLRIGFSTALSGSGETEITDEFTAPGGVVFGDHVDVASAKDVLIDLTESIGVWFEIDVAALNTVDASKDMAALQVQAIDV